MLKECCSLHSKYLAALGIASRLRNKQRQPLPDTCERRRHCKPKRTQNVSRVCSECEAKVSSQCGTIRSCVKDHYHLRVSFARTQNLLSIPRSKRRGQISCLFYETCSLSDTCTCRSRKQRRVTFFNNYPQALPCSVYGARAHYTSCRSCQHRIKIFGDLLSYSKQNMYVKVMNQLQQLPRPDDPPCEQCRYGLALSVAI